MQSLATAESQREENGGLVDDSVRLQGAIFLLMLATVVQALLIRRDAFETLDVAHELQDAVRQFHAYVVNWTVPKEKAVMSEFAFSWSAQQTN